MTASERAGRRASRHLLGSLLLGLSLAFVGTPERTSAIPVFGTTGAGSVTESSLDIDGAQPTLTATDGPGSVSGHSASVMGAHESDEGFVLVAESGESVTRGGRCSGEAPVRSYDVVAIAVEITLNRFLDYDPYGRMYVLEEHVASVRAEEAANRAARETGGEPAVSLGLQGDAIQPLTLRVLPGECLRVGLRNDLPAPESVSLHIHGSQMVVVDNGLPAIATEPSAMARPGETVTYEWAVPANQPEGTHHFHSHGDTRSQTVHGLFGAVVVEPPGSIWRDALTGEQDTTSWAAVVVPPDGAAFREFVIYYHEVGTESFAPLAADGSPLPLVDPITSSYKPSGRAINYRSEPFMHRLQLQVDRGEIPDESIAYSSYAFGDPATPIMRSYVGEPIKQRVVHGGSETFHVHHVHGGSIRWPRQPGLDSSPAITAVEKHPPLTPSVTERTDSQSLGPSETFDVEPECGSGGCQQSVGDLLFHCHVAHHYISGMWGIWRVYNTLQDGPASTDQLPPLPALQGWEEEVVPAVTSDRLSTQQQGRIEDQLPPPGVPVAGDASVWDWSKEGNVYFGEPEEGGSWPGYSPATTGRPALLFNPRDGRLAYPHLRPHLGRRPPFAPGHGPAPFLDPADGTPEVPRPGENGDSSVCPAGSRVRSFDVVAIEVPIPLNPRRNLVDPNGLLFVLREERDRIVGDPEQRVPLVLRVNAGVDCVDITLVSEVSDRPDNHGLSKVNMHIHFFQFDVQGSDGVSAGFNYEQSVRPWTVESEAMTHDVAAGSTRLPMVDTERFRPGALVMVGVDTVGRSEVRTVAAVEEGALVLGEPTEHRHEAGERVTSEFVRYRWYPDVQFGTAFFHDHVNAIVSGRHGLWGALIAEPPDATWHDPDTGEELMSGSVADIHTTGSVSVDVSGSFRELVVFVQDGNPLTKLLRSSGGSLGLRAEPLAPRVADDRATAFDSSYHGDPETVVLRARVGDPVVLRSLVSAANDVHTIHIAGHGFRVEPWSDTSPLVAAAHLGISERSDLVILSAGGPARIVGDYLLRAGRAAKMQEGSWGLLRVLPEDHPEAPLPLPGVDAAPPGDSICPQDAPVRSFDVTALEVALPMLGGGRGLAFVPTAETVAVSTGTWQPAPLVIRATVGDCLEVTVRNEASRAVSFEPDLIVFDPGERAVGHNGGAPIPPGDVRVSRFYAHPGFGEATVLVIDGGDPIDGPAIGGYAAIALASAGATFQDPVTAAPVAMGWQVVVVPLDSPPYRDAVLFFHEQDATIGTHVMPYRDTVRGTVGLNYAFCALTDRLAGGADPATVYSTVVHGEPATPLIEAYAGDPVRLRVLAPVSEQGQVFTMEGHSWAVEQRPGATQVSSIQIGGMEALTIDLEGGAGGRALLPGDYLYGNHREPYREAGMWGLMRVHDPGASDIALRPLATTDGPHSDEMPPLGGGPGAWVWLLVVVMIAGVGLVAWLLGLKWH